MLSARIRQVCRSPNPFTPSRVLWQHYVVANLPGGHIRGLASSATPTVEEPSATGPVTENDNESLPAQTLSQAMKRKTFAIRKYAIGEVAIQNNRGLVPKKGWRSRFPDRGGGQVLHPYDTDLTNSQRWRYMSWWSGAVRDGMKDMEDAMDRLNYEIWKFHAFSVPSEPEKAARKHTVEHVRSLVQEILPEDPLDVFGSQRTSLAMARSDIDFRLSVPRKTRFVKGMLVPSTANNRKQFLHKLYKLRQHLLVKKLNCEVVFARYPLLLFEDPNSLLRIQIVIADETAVSSELMFKYMQEYPYLRRVYSVVRTMFDVRELTNTKEGGFGSYAIFMMIVACLKHSPPERQDAAGGLLRFLEFWASFDTSKAISITPPVLFDKKQPGSRLLSLVDPADPTNDLGRKARDIKHVQATCAYLHRSLTEKLQTSGEFPPSYLFEIVGVVPQRETVLRKKLSDLGMEITGWNRKSPEEREAEWKERRAKRKSYEATMKASEAERKAEREADEVKEMQKRLSEKVGKVAGEWRNEVFQAQEEAFVSEMSSALEAGAEESAKPVEVVEIGQSEQGDDGGVAKKEVVC